jgi:hypothetical protein
MKQQLLLYTATILYPLFMNQVIQSQRRPHITISGVSLAYILLSALDSYMLSSGTRLHARYLHGRSTPSYMWYDNLSKHAVDKFFICTYFSLQFKMSSILNILSLVAYEFVCRPFHHDLTNVSYNFNYERLDRIVF